MPRHTSKQISWQASLVLVLLGAAAGYSCFQRMSFWGGTESRYRTLYITGFFLGALAFIAGLLSFLILAVRAVSTGQTATPHSPELPNQSNASDASDPQLIGVVRSESDSVGSRLMNNGLRTALIAIVILNTLSIWYWGGPPLESSYGYWYWVRVAITFFLTQLPYAVALIRICKRRDTPGLALAMSASAMQILAAFFANLRYPGTTRDAWPWLSVALGVVVITLGCASWRSNPKRKNDVGLLISVFFGLLVYTTLAQIVVAILHASTHA